MAIRKSRAQMVMSSAEIAAVYENWGRSEDMSTATKTCPTCGLSTPDGTCPDCDTTCGTCGLLTPDGTCPDCARAETLEQIANRVTPNGGKQAAMKSAKVRAKQAAEAARQARNAYLDANDYWRAMVLSYGEDSPQAQRALAERDALAR
jgi:RNA polymerase subunit RPABC4/transcription elongation factor Spt4